MVLPNAKQLIDADALISCFFIFVSGIPLAYKRKKSYLCIPYEKRI